MAVTPYHPKILGIALALAATGGAVQQATAQTAQETSYNGKLERRSPRDGEIYDSHPLQLSAGKRYEIGVESTEFDPQITLTDPDAEVIAEDDDGGEGNNSLIEFSPTRSGTYRIRVKAVDDGKAGAAYKLTMRELRPLPAPVRAKPATTASLRMESYGGSLDASDGEVNKRYEDEYVFHVEGGQTMLFFLNSSAIDPVLQIYDLPGRTTGRSIDQDDDGGSGQNAFIAFSPKDSGDYIVRATSANEHETGAYTLRAVLVPAD